MMKVSQQVVLEQRIPFQSMIDSLIVELHEKCRAHGINPYDLNWETEMVGGEVSIQSTGYREPTRYFESD